MKLFYNTRIIFLALLFVLSITTNGQNIKHKSLDYTPLGGLLKAEPSEFLSEIIEIPIKNPEPFIAIGLNATLEKTNPNTQFFIRVSVDGDDWSDWKAIENDGDAEVSKNRFLGSLAFFEKENRFMQFRTNVFATLEKLRFSFISPGKTSLIQQKANLEKANIPNSILAVERPEFVSRKGWNCPQDENVSSRNLTNVTHLIIHHSAGNTVSSDYAAVVRSYWDYHVNGHGWADIGYNWLVDPNGVLYKGRAWQSSTKENVIGAHNSGKNGNTAGICFIGNYVSSRPSDAGLNKVSEIAAFLCDKYGIEPEGKSYHAAIGKTNDNITGHGQSGGGTSCPGTQLINRMQSIRELTTSKILDITATPMVVATYPNSEVDSAYLTKKISVEFTHPMNKASVEAAFTITPSANGVLSWNADDNKIFFDPSSPLLKKTNYEIKISSNALSKWEVPIAESIIFSFVTKANNNLSVATYPQNGDAEIDLGVLIKLQFDSPLLVSSLSGNILLLDSENYAKYLVDKESANFIEYNVITREFEEGLVEITPKNSLEANALYYIILTDVISSTEGFTQGKTNVISFSTKSPTSVVSSNVPDDYRVITAYPNPFNPSTTIEYNLKKSSHVSIKIYDIIGKEVLTLVNKNISAGSHKIVFNANNLPSGVYFSQIITNSETKTIKLLLTK